MEEAIYDKVLEQLIEEVKKSK
ncbi:hypothetical protein [Lysinibacillus xylanilyticus]